ncbi:hypothetical protein HK100_002142 [Physocladia obscura]|uniref:Homoserine dehydrogenase n=1 Tax=Physocladia obscura TaxID=109957 RepID=A0AAD5SYX0_9FUNG|nr:hypothetical protein HK100_002142 [Physocladia obscura]
MSSLSIALIGPGLVGTEVLGQIAAHGGAGLRVVAVASSRRVAVAGAGDDGALGLFAAADDALDALTAAAQRHRPCVVVDCTASGDVAARYPAWLALGLHVVTPNKKPFAGPRLLFDAIRSAARAANVSALHEASVGAGLPILSTLSDLVDTGDSIVKIEGILSGTLSYIFNNFSSTSTAANQTPLSFSAIVNEARQNGYTEPDPRDDLNGMDVARKVVILARVAGLNLSLEDLPIENTVPEPLRAIPSADEFMVRLPDFDAHFAALNDAARARGKVLRCVGVVDPVNPSASGVKLAEYDASHPFASLKGSDNIIAFTTKRFPNPLIVQGAGAGAAVTAFGVFSDILKIKRQVEYASRLHPNTHP